MVSVHLRFPESYWFFQLRQEQERHDAVEATAPSEEPQGTVEEEKETLAGLTTDEEASLEALPEEVPDAPIEEKVAGFFRYLDSQEYVQQMVLINAYHIQFLSPPDSQTCRM